MRSLFFTLLLPISSSLLADVIDSNSEVTRFLVDYSYYEEFSPKVLGVYVIFDDAPIKIIEDTQIMSQVMSRFIFLSKNPHSYKNLELNDNFRELMDINLMEKFSQKHYNHHVEIRNIELILERSKKQFSLNNIKLIYNAINEYNQKKKDFYGRQNNEDGIAFCNDIEKTLLKPLKRIGYKLNSKPTKDKEINSLSKNELKLFWNDFKKTSLGLIQTYFDANKEALITISSSNTFEIPYNKKYKYYFLCINMFGQNWYLELYDDYSSDAHEVSLINL